MFKVKVHVIEVYSNTYTLSYRYGTTTTSVVVAGALPQLTGATTCYKYA